VEEKVTASPADSLEAAYAGTSKQAPRGNERKTGGCVEGEAKCEVTCLVSLGLRWQLSPERVVLDANGLSEACCQSCDSKQLELLCS